MYIYIYVFVYIYNIQDVYVYVCMCVCIYMYTHKRIRACLCVLMCVSIHINDVCRYTPVSVNNKIEWKVTRSCNTREATKFTYKQNQARKEFCVCVYMYMHACICVLRRTQRLNGKCWRDKSNDTPKCWRAQINGMTRRNIYICNSKDVKTMW